MHHSFLTKIPIWLTAAAAFLALASPQNSLYSDTPPTPGVSVTKEGKADTMQKSEKATQEVKGKFVPYTVSFDPDTWVLLEKNINPMAEYSFELKNGDSFAMILPEKQSVSLDAVPNIILKGAEKNGVENAQILEQERKNVNGTDVLYLKWSGDINKTKFVYTLYVYSGDKGTVQVIGYTLDDLAPNLQDEIMEFLNGFSMNQTSDENNNLNTDDLGF